MKYFYVRDPVVDIHLPVDPMVEFFRYRHVDHLSERTKELNCLYRVFKILGEADASVDSMLQRVVAIIPFGWQFTDLAVVKIEIESLKYSSHNFSESQWFLKESIFANKNHIGEIVVCYSEKRPENFKGPFLEEEVFMFEAIAKMIGQSIERKVFADERQRLNQYIQASYEKILRGIIPICASCKSIRDEDGKWHQLESYVQNRTEATFSHGVCPNCIKELYPDLDLNSDGL